MGAAATGAGLGIMGGILGGVGDIMSAANYERPSLPEPGGQEARLRRLAQNQLLAGGQQSLGGMALYNQMAPLLMGMLPGLSYVPGTASSLGGVTGDATGGGQGGLSSYQDSLRLLQETQARNQQLADLKRQRNAAKGKAAKKAFQPQIKALKQAAKAAPRVQDAERRMYQAGTQVSPEMYDIRRAPAAAPPSGLDGMSLGAIRGMMDAEAGNEPDLMALYRGMGG